MKKQISTNNVNKAVGPYSQAIYINGFLFISGQIPLNPTTMEIEQGIENQTHRVMYNIIEILKQENMNVNNLVKTSIFLTDITNFDIVNSIYASYLEGTIFPARETIEVSKLPKNSLIEISAIASKF